MSLLTPHNFPGKLIIVEGIDGSGKSTQLQLAMRYLQAKGLRPFFTEWNSADLVKAITKKGRGRDVPDADDVFRCCTRRISAHRLVHNILPPLKAGMIRAGGPIRVHGVCPGRGAWVRSGMGARHLSIRAPRPIVRFISASPSTSAMSRLLSGRAKLKDYEAGMDLGWRLI